jgi:hypothetical protein
LHRVLVDGVGAPPLALARAQRAQTARLLIETTRLSFSDIAFAAGFSSVRQFNETIRQTYASSPSALRGAHRNGEPSEPGRLTARLAFRQPFDAAGLLRWLGARTVAARLVATHGTPLAEPDGDITHAFPEPHVVAEAGLEGIGLTRSRRGAVRELSRRIAIGELVLDGGADRAEVHRRLLEIPGVGAWTAAYVSLRALGDPDAFPAGDVGLRRAAVRLGLPDSAAALAARSQRWRPWRAYAAHYLWAVDA